MAQVNYYSPVQGYQQGVEFSARQRRNALAEQAAEQELAQAPTRNRLAQMQMEGQQQTLDANKAKIAYATLKQAMDSGNPRAFVLQNVPDLAAKLAEQGHDLTQMDDESASQLIGMTARHVAGQAGIAPEEPIQAQQLGGMNVLTQGGRYVGSSKIERPYDIKTQPGPNGSTIVTDGSSFRVVDPQQTKQREAPSGYQWKADGSGLEVVPGGPADPANPKNDRADLKQVQSLRKEFESMESVKNYRLVLPLYERALKAPNSRAGDLSVIYALGKMFDPGSVVRDGELQLTKDAQPWLRKMVFEANSQITGQGAFDPTTRAAIMDALRGQVEAFRQPYMQERERFSAYAGESGFKPDQVVGPDASTAFEQPAPSGQPVQVKSPEEAMALPKGTVFITPDGRRKVR